MKPLGVSVIGYGLGGRVFHVPLLAGLPEYSLRWVSGSAFSGDSAKYPAVRSGSPEDILRDRDTEMVVITTPNQTHGPLTRQALEAGKHVVVDKPFCDSAREARDLSSLARKKGLMLTVFQNRRWDGDFLTVQKLLREGRLGTVVHLESSFPRYRLKIRDTWKEEQTRAGGLLWDLGPHLLDQALVLFGKPSGWRGDFRLTRPEARSIDDFEIILEYGPGLRVILKAAMVRPWPGPRFEIHGTLGSYVKYGMDPQEEALKSGYFPGPGWGTEPPESHGILYTRDDQGLVLKEPVPTTSGDYGDFYRQTALAVRQRGVGPVDPEENSEIIAILEDLSKTALAGTARYI